MENQKCVCVLYQTESLLSSEIGSMFSSKYTSFVKETSVSWAELKFVTLRVGMPKHLRTEKERWWNQRNMEFFGNTKWQLKQHLTWQILIIHTNTWCTLTCSGDPWEDPTLPVFDRQSSAFVVLLQNIHTATPCRWGSPICIDTRPIAFQHALVIRRVDLVPRI